MTVKKPIVVVGSINIDLVADAPRIPRAGETLIGTGFTTTPGGKGANQAVAVACLGYPVHMLGAVGEDVFGQALIDHLAAMGVATGAVTRVSGPSGVAAILVAASGENSIVVVPGANGKVTPAFIDQQKSLIASAGMVLCQLELPIETVTHTLAVCADVGIPVILDPAPATVLPQSVWTKVAWFTPNETEAAFYVEGASSPEAAEQLLSRGLSGVVLKRGSENAWLAQKGRCAGVSVPTFPVEAIDTVAAGDCFNGAFAVALLEGRTPEAAASFAAAAAAISVTRRGAQASMPNRTDVESFLSRHL
ncbi:MAG: ribokinase [Terracidiphilus sp.]